MDAQAIRFLQVALTTVLVYSCVLCWDYELEYIWKKRISSTTVLYFTLRYFGIAFMVLSSAAFITNPISTDKFVTRYTPALSLWINCFVLWVNQFILQLRLHALYGGSRKILLLTGIGFVMEIITMIVCVALVTISVDGARPNLDVKFSAIPNLAVKVYIHHASMMAYECLLFSVAFYAALRRYREEFGPLNWTRVMRLTDVLIEGNVVYFLITMAYGVFSIGVILTLRIEWVLGLLNVGFSLAVTIGSHLILQIRRAVSSTTVVYVIGEEEPAPSWLSMIFLFFFRRSPRHRRSLSFQWTKSTV